MKTVMIKGVEHFEVLSPTHECEHEEVKCGYRGEGCTHPQVREPGVDYCMGPPRIFVQKHEIPIVIRLRLKS